MGRELHISIWITHSAYMSHVYGSRNLSMYMRREHRIYVFITHELRTYVNESRTPRKPQSVEERVELNKAFAYLYVSQTLHV